MENYSAMIFEQRKFFFKTIRIILDDEVLKRTLQARSHSYITGLSYNNFPAGSEVHIKSKKTTVIELGDDYFKRFNDTTRNEIRRTEKVSDLSFQIPDTNRDAVYRLYRAFESEGNRIVRPAAYFHRSVFFGAYLGGELMAAILCYDAYPYMRAHAIVSSLLENSLHRKWKSFVLRRLVFEICNYGKERDYLWFDLGGVNLSDEEKAGITAFKLGFGGRMISEYTYTYKSPFLRFLKILNF